MAHPGTGPVSSGSLGTTASRVPDALGAQEEATYIQTFRKTMTGTVLAMISRSFPAERFWM